MIAVGKYNQLEILRETSVGLFLGDGSGEDILLPKKYCPERYSLHDELTVFVYRDHEDRKIATNIHPKILLHQFAFLEVKAVNKVGAFLDWGLEKELMVPFKEQRQNMEEGRWYVVYLELDEKTDRLYATNKLNKRLQNENVTVEEGEEVDLLVIQRTDLGFSVIVNQQHKGLVFHNEVFQPIHVGDSIRGFIKNIRPDGKLDVSLQPLGYDNSNDPNVQLIFQRLLDYGGFIGLSDKSAPEEIYEEFEMSKKAFKKAIGSLYKARKIEIRPEGIQLAK